MTHTTARCGCSVVAVGAPGSLARRAVESRTCDKPRCRSGLPPKFTDDECEAYCWLTDRDVSGWVVDHLTKQVFAGDTERFRSLLNYAISEGWNQ